jgi:hypothetical protein
MPSPGGQVSGMAAPCHPDDLPEGYHTATRGRSCRSSAGGRIEGRPRASAWSGCARSTGWHSAGGGARAARHQEGITNPDTVRYG